MILYFSLFSLSENQGFDTRGGPWLTWVTRPRFITADTSCLEQGFGVHDIRDTCLKESCVILTLPVRKAEKAFRTSPRLRDRAELNLRSGSRALNLSGSGLQPLKA